MINPKVSIIVLNYNRPADTIDCINSLLKNDYPSYEIIIIDNYSTDDSLNAFKTCFPDLSIYSTNENLGYTGGINFGILKAKEKKPDYILLINNDTIVEPDFLSHMVLEMENHPDAYASCCLILAEHDRNTIWYAGGKLIKWRGLAIHSLKDMPRSALSNTKTREVDFVTGCLILLRTSELDYVGLENELFFMYLDDIELSSRIITKGLKLLFVPKAVIYHKVLNEKESPLKLYYSVRNRLLLIKEMNKNLDKLIAGFYFITVISLKLFFWKFKNKKFYYAAKKGLDDYRNGIFYKGSGMQFLESNGK